MESEMTLRELFITMLRRWRVLFLFAFVFMALLGGYKAYTTIETLPSQEDVSKIERENLKSTELYERDKLSRQHEIDRLNAKMERAEQYNENSLLMQIDPYNKRVAKLVFSINVDNDVTFLNIGDEKTLGLIDLKSTVVERILNRYLLLISNASLHDVLGELVDVYAQNRYLSEIVSVERSGEGVITIQVFGTPELDAVKAVDAVYGFMLEKQATVATATGEHSLALLDRSDNTIIDTELADLQWTNQQQPVQLGQSIKDKTGELEALQEPEVKTFLTMEAAIKSGIKYGILGFIVGLCFGAAIAFFTAIMGTGVQNAEQVRRMLKLRFLGSMEPRRIRRGLDGIADRMAGDTNTLDEQASLALVNANICEAAGDAKTILLTGTIDEAKLEAIADKLSSASGGCVRFLAGPNIIASADTVAKLRDADGVVLVETKKKSSITTVASEVERIGASGKNVYGFVMA